MVVVSRRFGVGGPLALLARYAGMGWNATADSPCPSENCSGHGECLNGTCFCEIQFVGEECNSTNTSYFASFATVFFLVALVCLVQLVVCIAAEWQRLKAPSLLRACRITTQKLLYFVVFLASVIRGAYFTSPTAFQEGWSRSLLSAYYPLLLSGSSLIVCFWAEIFHLRDLNWEHRQFISKSFLGFAAFNVISYSLLVAEFLTAKFFANGPELESFYSHVFNGCYAVLLFIVVIFFLIYGVEVYFKVRGGFLVDEMPPSRPLAEEARQLFDSKSEVGTGRAEAKSVDTSQLHQSRLGLLSQAVMMLVVVIFLCSETLGEFWKSKVPIYSRNWHNLVFRVVEIGVALWFPCVLWNCMSPEELWILNPKRLLKRKDSLVDKGGAGRPGPSRETWEKQETASNGSDGSGDCWICYDPGRSDAGPLIQPCQCKGDVRTVHHNCLLKWLMERSNKTSKTGMRCGVCGSEYRISFAGKVDFSRLLTSQSWAQTVATIGAISLAAVSSCLVVQYVGNAVAKALLVGSALLVIYVCTKFFCQKQIEAYQRAKVSTVNIESSNGAAGISVAVPTISDSLEEIPSSVKAGKGKKAMMAMKQSSSTSSLMMMKPSSNAAMKHSSSVSSLAMKSSAVDPSTDALLPPKSSPRDKGVVEL